jgi:hypothetical protein
MTIPILYHIDITKTNHPKSGYQTKWGNLNGGQASLYWQGLNIGNGYKARLRDKTTGNVIARKG